MLTPAGEFSAIERLSPPVANTGRALPGASMCSARTALSDGSNPPETTARASALSKARVMTGVYCLIDSPIGLLNEEVPALLTGSRHIAAAGDAIWH